MWPGTCGEIDYNRGDSADEPEVEQAGIDLAGAKDAAGADETPDDAGVEEDAALGA